MQNIKNIIFDLGGVILNLDMKRSEEAFVSMGLAHFRDLFGQGHADSFFKEYETGKIDDRQFLQAVKDAIGLPVTDQAVTDAWNAMLLDFPSERIVLLEKLSRQYRLFLFSNTNALHLAAFRQKFRDAFGNRELDDHFERTYYSHLLKMRKPSVESYRYILEGNSLKGSETLFVDDALINVEGANAAGLKGFHLRPGMTILDMAWG